MADSFFVPSDSSDPTTKGGADSLFHANSGMWTCKFCGTTGITANACPNCGATRPEDTYANAAVSVPSVEIAAPAPSPTQANADAEVFLLNRDNRDFVRGTSQRVAPNTPIMGCVAVFFIPFVLMGLVVVGLALTAWADTIELRQSGVLVQGQVVDRWITTDKNNAATYHVSYQFYANDHKYNAQGSVAEDVYNSLKSGGKISIIYARARPTNSQIGDKPPDFGAPLCVSGFALLWNGFIWAIVGGMIRNALIWRFLSKNGRVVRGTVQSCNGSTSRSTYNVRVKYKFRSPTGRDLTRSESRARNDLRRGPLPHPGTSVAILYGDDRRFRLL